MRRIFICSAALFRHQWSGFPRLQKPCEITTPDHSAVFLQSVFAGHRWVHESHWRSCWGVLRQSPGSSPFCSGAGHWCRSSASSLDRCHDELALYITQSLFCMESRTGHERHPCCFPLKQSWCQSFRSRECQHFVALRVNEAHYGLPIFFHSSQKDGKFLKSWFVFAICAIVSNNRGGKSKGSCDVARNSRIRMGQLRRIPVISEAFDWKRPEKAIKRISSLLCRGWVTYFRHWRVSRWKINGNKCKRMVVVAPRM